MPLHILRTFLDFTGVQEKSWSLGFETSRAASQAQVHSQKLTQFLRLLSTPSVPHSSAVTPWQTVTLTGVSQSGLLQNQQANLDTISGGRYVKVGTLATCLLLLLVAQDACLKPLITISVYLWSSPMQLPLLFSTQSNLSITQACQRKASRPAQDLSFRAALWVDNKLGAEGSLVALLRTDSPLSCGSLPQTESQSHRVR